MSTVVIQVYSFQREYFAAWVLAKRLEGVGYKVIITSRLINKYFLKLFKPDILILSHAEVSQLPALHQLFKYGTKIYINEIEGLLYEEKGLIPAYPENYNYSIISGIFEWNQWTKDWLIKNRNINDEQIYVIGSIRNSCLYKNNNNNHLNTNKTIGIVCRFATINGYHDNTYQNRHIFTHLMNLDPVYEPIHTYINAHSLQMEEFITTIGIINKCIELGHKITIRPHPLENRFAYNILKERYGEAIEIDNSYSFIEFLNKVDIIISPLSTSYTDAYLLQIPIISIDNITKYQTSENKLELLMGAYQPKTIDEVLELCNREIIVPLKSSHFENYIDIFYSLKNNPDPIKTVIDIVQQEIKASDSLKSYVSYYKGITIKVILDLLALCKLCINSHPILSIIQTKQLDYNCFLHRPNIFMKNMKKYFK